MHSLSRACQIRPVWLLFLGLFLFACGDPIVLGGIPPSTFQFTNVVPHDGEGAGGWKAAQVAILLGRLSPQYPEAALCELEVGVPEVSAGGLIPTARVQQAAATAANEAARLALRQRLPLATACDKLRKTMHSLMSTPGGVAYIPGAKVGTFYFSGLPRQTFP